MFSVGQKVVFIGATLDTPPDCILPPVNSIQTICAIDDDGSTEGYSLKGYESAQDGISQWFTSEELCPLQPARKIETAKIASELILMPETLDAPTPIRKPQIV